MDKDCSIYLRPESVRDYYKDVRIMGFIRANKKWLGSAPEKLPELKRPSKKRSTIIQETIVSKAEAPISLDPDFDILKPNLDF